MVATSTTLGRGFGVFRTDEAGNPHTAPGFVKTRAEAVAKIHAAQDAMRATYGGRRIEYPTYVFEAEFILGTDGIDVHILNTWEVPWS